MIFAPRERATSMALRLSSQGEKPLRCDVPSASAAASMAL